MLQAERALLQQGSRVCNGGRHSSTCTWLPTTLTILQAPWQGRRRQKPQAQAEIDKMREERPGIRHMTANGSSELTIPLRARRSALHECEEGKIFIEPQGWSQFSSGLGKDEGAGHSRHLTAYRQVPQLQSTVLFLTTLHTHTLLHPVRRDLHISRRIQGRTPVSSAHNNAWIICAEAAC